MRRTPQIIHLTPINPKHPHKKEAGGQSHRCVTENRSDWWKEDPMSQRFQSVCEVEVWGKQLFPVASRLSTIPLTPWSVPARTLISRAGRRKSLWVSNSHTTPLTHYRKQSNIFFLYLTSISIIIFRSFLPSNWETQYLLVVAFHFSLPSHPTPVYSPLFHISTQSIWNHSASDDLLQQH